MEVERLKALLGVPKSDTSKDASLWFILDDVEETIKNYCNLRELPQGLTNTAYRMAMDLYRAEAVGEDVSPMTVTSITEGDTSTSFKASADVIQGTILKNYKAQLNRYRKLG